MPVPRAVKGAEAWQPRRAFAIAPSQSAAAIALHRNGCSGSGADFSSMLKSGPFKQRIVPRSRCLGQLRPRFVNGADLPFSDFCERQALSLGTGLAVRRRARVSCVDLGSLRHGKRNSQEIDAIPGSYSMKIRRIMSLIALCLWGTSAGAAVLTMEECKAKYKAVLASGTHQYTWADYQVKQCGLPPQPTRKPKSSR